jgi:hypothetical protein
MQQVRVFLALFALVALVGVPAVFGQGVEVPLTITDGVGTNTIYFGAHTGANICIDPADGGVFGHNEGFLPPSPPPDVFEVKFVQGTLPRIAGCYDNGSPNDYRPLTAFFTQRDTFFVKQQGSGSPKSVSWPSLSTKYVGPVTLRYNDGENNVDINMLTSNTVNLVGLANEATFRIIAVGPLPPPTDGPCFSASPSPLNFNANVTLTLTVANTGATNPLNISNVVSSLPEFTVTPTAGTVTPGGSMPFQVTFAGIPGTNYDGILTFTHNALDPACGTGTESTVPVHGFVSPQGGTLQFSVGQVYRCDNSNGFSETVQLAAFYAGQPLKALQARILVPLDLLSNVGGVTRGSSVPSPAWNFSSTITHGLAYDTVKVVLFGNGSNSLASGNVTPYNLIRFNYSTANITQNALQTSIKLADVLGAQPNGSDALVMAGPDQVVNVVNSTVRGDVNGDDVLDILDLLLIVDHILNRITLVPPASTNADVAPWPLGDNVINVLDLALLQDIILNGTYPTALNCELGLPRPPSAPSVAQGNGLSKLSPGMDVKLTLYISEEGIRVRMENRVAVKGVQLEFRTVPSIPQDLQVTRNQLPASLRLVDDLLRVLSFDGEHGDFIPANTDVKVIGDMDFSLANPGAVQLVHYVVAGAGNERIENVEIEISGQTPADRPLEFALKQNYPNPFNPTTYIQFQVPQATTVRIAIFNTLGQEVATVFEGAKNEGTWEVAWNGKDKNGVNVPSGMYLVRMTAGEFVQSRKMMLLK